ncbi:MAG: hypothetical protein ACYCV4_06450 [Dermatophilaceae bacterium]
MRQQQCVNSSALLKRVFAEVESEALVSALPAHVADAAADADVLVAYDQRLSEATTAHGISISSAGTLSDPHRSQVCQRDQLQNRRSHR